MVRHEPHDVVKKWANAPHDSHVDNSMNLSGVTASNSSTIQRPNCCTGMSRAHNVIAKASRLRGKGELSRNLFSIAPPLNNIDEVLKNLSSGASNAKKQKLQTKLVYNFEQKLIIYILRII